MAGDRVLVAVSGGSDSVALLHLLWRLRDELDIDLCAAHLDHALRAESRDEADFVRRFCAALCVPLVERRISVNTALGRGQGGVEQVAREVRYAFLREAAAEAGCQLIALGHHRGDQAETLLQRLVRGSGPGGLAAMQPRSGTLIRPLLDISREEILAYLCAHDLSWVEDPSNRDPRFTRNRIRSELLPLLQTFNPRIEDGLCRLAQRLACEEDYWAAQVGSLSMAEGEVRLALGECRRWHPALRDRMLRRAMEQVRGDLRRIEEKHVNAAAALLQGGGEYKECHLPGLWVAADCGVLRLRGAPPQAALPFSIEIPAPGSYVLPEGRTLQVSLSDQALGEGAHAVEFCACEIPFPLRVRSWHAGDRIRPTGLGGQKKVKDVFREARLPREERGRVPLLLGAGRVLWVAGLRRCEGLLPLPEPGKILRVVLDDAKMETLRL